MAINPERAQRVLHRDRHACRLRFYECTGEATEVVMSVGPSFGGGDNYGNLRAACSGCTALHEIQQRRAARLFRVAG
jgi:hypothetical protein